MIPPISCKRAAEVLHGLQTGQLQVTADEIEQLLKAGLAVEADPDHLAAANRLQAVHAEFAEHFTGDRFDPAAIRSALADIESKLKSDWYRLRTSSERLQEHETHRAELRRALGIVQDEATLSGLRKLVSDAALIAPGAGYVVCRSLGIEMYALTRLGQRVSGELSVRLARVGDAPLSSFLKSFFKVDAKMQAFGRDLAHISQNLGYVRKNPEQVAIGLVKSGLSPNDALRTYHQAMSETRAPDMAVVATRNARQAGGASQANQRLARAIGALRKASFPPSQEVMSAAKTLLAFDPPEAGVPRFVDLFQRIRGPFGNGPHVFKFLVRLMPASGTPAECVHRATTAVQMLRYGPSRARPQADPAPTGVAIAAIVKEDRAIKPAIQRLREIENELLRLGIGEPFAAEQNALECLACPGTPAEVVSTVRSLCLHLAPQWPPARATVNVAVSFAKRFAY